MKRTRRLLRGYSDRELEPGRDCLNCGTDCRVKDLKVPLWCPWWTRPSASTYIIISTSKTAGNNPESDGLEAGETTMCKHVVASDDWAEIPPNKGTPRIPTFSQLAENRSWPENGLSRERGVTRGSYRQHKAVRRIMEPEIWSLDSQERQLGNGLSRN